MLMNYPKDDIKFLLDDPEFLEGENILKYHEQKQKGHGHRKRKRS